MLRVAERLTLWVGAARMQNLGARLVAEITIEEVQEAVDLIYACKASALVNVATECLERGGSTIVK